MLNFQQNMIKKVSLDFTKIRYALVPLALGFKLNRKMCYVQKSQEKSSLMLGERKLPGVQETFLSKTPFLKLDPSS